MSSGPLATSRVPDGLSAPYRPIGDYAIIGDCRAAALISRGGSLDWLCLPRFDSPSIFGAILDARHGGRFVVQPRDPFTTTRRYVGDTNVLETTFATATGTARVTDAMAVAAESDRAGELWPDHEILRKVEGIAGHVLMEVLFDPRPNYGRSVPRIKREPGFGWIAEHGAQVLVLESDIPLAQDARQPGIGGTVALQRGDARMLSLTFDERGPAVRPSCGPAADAQLARSIRWWEDWARHLCYNGPYRAAVMRSALTLKLLTFAPSGAVIAAPTTSLPEAIGSVRNWDYRYCWLRDASLTLRALLDLGYTIEAEAFLSWMLHATRLTWPELQVLYDVYGEANIPETELAHFEGYARSSPVRVGNAAIDQLQLDTYGEVIDAAVLFVARGGRLDRTTSRVLTGLGETVCRRWRDPDEGIWEPRAGRQHHTHSKVMCWVALDRLLTLAANDCVRGPVDRFVRERDALRREIETRGYNERIQSYVSVFDGADVDASLLLLGVYGYADPSEARMRHTCERINERLGVDGLLYRYRADDGLPPGEGAFGICSFWAIECMARRGELTRASRMFEHLLEFGNDVGLFAEQIDPDTGTALGNFPQAFTHLGLINAALTLAEAGGHRVAPPAITGQRGTSEGRV
jgi:GH15 family glucan-1,4-alpha-glucosidase